MTGPPRDRVDYARTALPHAQTRTVRWQDVLTADIDQPRQLTTDELHRLHKLGFHHLARALAAGVCHLTDDVGDGEEECGLNKSTRCHRETCDRPEPLPAPAPKRSPWEPKPMSERHRNAA